MNNTNSTQGANNIEQKSFAVSKLEWTQHYTGKSEEGFPVFFVHTNASKSSTSPIRLKLLEVDFLQRCKLIDDNGQEFDDLYSIISLKSSDKDLCLIFEEILTMSLKNMEAFPSCREIYIAVENISSIFSQISVKSNKPIQGLWAELLLIERSSYPELLVSAWHRDPTDTYDFTEGANKIEVKSTSKDERQHHFSGEQLTPTRHSNLVVASIMVKSSGVGEGAESIKTLCEKIQAKVTIGAWKKLYEIVIQTLGNDYHSYSTKYFDYVSAADSIKFFYLPDIDRIQPENIPGNVHRVEYDVDLSNVPAIGDSDSTFNLYDKQLYKALL